MNTETYRYRGYDIVPDRPVVPVVREGLCHTLPTCRCFRDLPCNR